MGDRSGGSRIERKRRDILEAGREIFLGEGYAGAGMEGVARAAGVSTATLYAHFPSKADLFKAVMEEAITGLTDEIAAANLEPGEARERLLGFALAMGRFYSQPLARSIFRVVTGERRRFTELADHFHLRSQAVLGGAAITLIGELAQNGHLKVDRPAAAAGQLLGMIEHPTLALGLMAGDEVKARRPLPAICEDAVDTFLARYGA